MSTELLRTPLAELHRSIGARMVPFAGWEMPVQYAGVIAEVNAVRTGVGIFDVSHMGRMIVRGTDTLAYLQSLVPSDLSRLKDDAGCYTFLPNASGGVVDDIIVYRRTETEFWVVFNAGCLDKDRAWFQGHTAGFDVVIDDITEQTGLLAVQGPAAMALLGDFVDSHARFGIGETEFAGIPITAARTGYTGEDGFEAFVAVDQLEQLWTAFTDAGVVPCGLGARDALRLEAAYPLYGHEMDDDVNPFSARLGWVIHKKKAADYVGRSAVETGRGNAEIPALVGLIMDGRHIARDGYPVQDEAGNTLGHVTSGTFSPILQKGVALARLSRSHAEIGTTVYVVIRDKAMPALVSDTPFVPTI